MAASASTRCWSSARPWACWPSRLQLITRFVPSSAYLDETAFCFAARDLTPDPLPADDDEFLDRRIVPLAEAIRMAVGDEIIESVSKVALLHYALTHRIST